MSDIPWDPSLMDEALQLLASNAEDQINWLVSALPHSGTDEEAKNDPLFECWELACNFDDHYPAVPDMVSEGLVSEKAASGMDALNSLLNELADQEDRSFWTFEGLRSRPEWERVRELATTALRDYRSKAPPPSA